MNSLRLVPHQVRLKKNLRSSEAFSPQGQDLSIRKTVFYILFLHPSTREPIPSSWLVGFLFFCRVKCHTARPLLDLPHGITLGTGLEGISCPSQFNLEVVCDITPSQVHSLNSMRHRKPFKHRHCVRHTISRIKNNPSCSPRGVQGENSLGGKEESGGRERFKEDLGGFLAVASRIQRSFSKKNRVLRRLCVQLLICLFPQLLHIPPPGHNTMLHGIVNPHQASKILSFLTNKILSLQRPRHHSIMFRCPDKGRKLTFRFISPCKPSLNGP
mmetsp:Transcript_8499/g.12877  ORF Transcript_8499/g.12877 Transcript_8499/m.12877 type:complete len:271 (+) Transcript_8499:356-1168(+)